MSQGLAPLNPNSVSGNNLYYQQQINNYQQQQQQQQGGVSSFSMMNNNSPVIMPCGGNNNNNSNANNNANDASITSTTSTSKTDSSIISASGRAGGNIASSHAQQVRRRKYTHNPYASSNASSRASSTCSTDNSSPSTPMNGSFAPHSNAMMTMMDSTSTMQNNNININNNTASNVMMNNNNTTAVAAAGGMMYVPSTSSSTSMMNAPTMMMMENNNNNNNTISSNMMMAFGQQQQQQQQGTMPMMMMMNNNNINNRRHSNHNNNNNMMMMNQQQGQHHQQQQQQMNMMMMMMGNNNNINNNNHNNMNSLSSSALSGSTNINTITTTNTNNSNANINNNNDVLMFPGGAVHSVQSATEQFDAMRGSLVANSCSQKGRHVVVAMIRLQQPDVSDSIFDELCAGWGALISDMNGCNVARAFVESYPSAKIQQLAESMTREVVLHMCSASQYSRRVLQSMFENHASAPYLQAIVDHVASGAVALATTQQGCISVMRVLEFSKAEQREQLMSVLTPHLAALAADPYGNYVLQTITQSLGSNEMVCCTLEKAFEGSWVALSCNKFASNVMEKVIRISVDTPASTARKTIIEELVCNNSHLSIIIGDGFGNFVLQAIIDSCNNTNEFKKIGDRIRPLLASSPYGHKIEGKLKSKRFGNSNSNSRASSQENETYQ